MRSQFASLRVLVLPFGALTGPRIILNGITGQIEIYDAANALVGRWNPTDFRVIGVNNGSIRLDPAQGVGNSPVIFMRPPDSPGIGAYTSAQIFAAYDGAETPNIAISGPKIPAETGAPRIDLFGSNGAVVRRINLAPNAGVNGAGGYVDIPQDTNKTSDLRIGNRSIDRGVIARVDTVADDALTSGTAELVDTLILNDQPVIAGRFYSVRAKVSFQAPAANSRAILFLHYTEDGSTPTTASPSLGNWVCNLVPIVTSGGTFLIEENYVPATNLDLSVGVFVLTTSNGGTFGTGDNAGWLKLVDEGKE